MGTKRIQMAAMTAGLNIRSSILTRKEERSGCNCGEEQRLRRCGLAWGEAGHRVRKIIKIQRSAEVETSRNRKRKRVFQEGRGVELQMIVLSL